MRLRTFSAAAYFAFVAAVSAAPPKAGTYELAVSPASSTESAYVLIKLSPKDDGSLAGELVAKSPRYQRLALEGVTLDGDTLRITLQNGEARPSFEANLPKAAGDIISGNYGDERSVQPARLRMSKKESLDAADQSRKVPVPAAMEKLNELNTKVRSASLKATSLQLQLRRATTDDAKAKLRKEIQAAQEEAKKIQAEAQPEILKLQREVVGKHADAFASAEVALSLLQRAKADNLPSADAAKFGALILKHAAPFGPRYEADRALMLAEMFARQAPYAALALEPARQAEARLTAKSPLEKQSRAKSVLALTLRAAGKSAEADKLDAQVAVIETELDRVYLSRKPAFEPESYTGRKAKSDRVVVVELFTGSECPPCVASDLAFDALENTYKPTEVALLQYHLHIPGPDPLTNPATEARQKQYKVSSTPSTFFSGKAAASGGGGAANAERKYKQFRDLIDQQLEDAAKATIQLHANRSGDTVTVRAKVSNLDEPGDTKKLRFVLVEESVRFAGGNGLRFHHMVVRDLPGGAGGFALAKKDSEHSATVNLETLRKNLTQYLDTSAEKRPFSKPARPMAMEHLKVVAIVQEGDDGEILQASVVNLGGESSPKK